MQNESKRSSAVWTGVLAGLLGLAPSPAPAFNPNAIFVADTGLCFYCSPQINVGSRIIAIDPTNGAQTIVSSGNQLNGAYTQSLVFTAGGLLAATNIYGNDIIGVDPNTGAQTIISSGINLNWGGGGLAPITVDAAGNLYTATQGALLVRVNPTTGVQTVVGGNTGLLVGSVTALTTDAAGNLIVAVTNGSSGSIVKVDPNTGNQALVTSSNTSGSLLSGYVGATGFAFDSSGNLMVANNANGVGGGSVFRIAANTGNQTLVTSRLMFPWGLTVTSSGQIIVADSLGFFGTPGRIVGVDPVTGNQTVIAQGGPLIDPRGVAVLVGVPFSAFSAKLEIDFGPSPNTDAFQLNSSFTLGSASDGINPLAEPVTLGVGTFATTIPPGSFQRSRFGSLTFEGTINGVALQVRITPTGINQYSFKAEARNASLTGTVNPVTVTLATGDDRGTTSVNADGASSPSRTAVR